MVRPMRSTHLVVVVLSGLAACGPSRGDDDDVVVDARIDARPADAAPGDTVDELPSRVYAHAGLTLYVLDTITLAQTRIGDFTNLPANQTMLDLAVDRDDRMIGITRDKIFEVDEHTAAATLLATLLIAANATGAVYRIDIAGNTATAVEVGSYGTQGAAVIGSSGDIVSVRGFGTVATVNVGTGMDYLARLDPTNGWRATVIGTGTGYDNIFGLGFWAGKLYGFVDDGFTAGTGAFVDINPTTGNATLVQAGAIRWFGAGVTTVAPLIP